jgi:protein FAM32A
MTKTAFMGGSLSFKNDKKKKTKKKKSKSKHSLSSEQEDKHAAAGLLGEHEQDDDELTEAEKKALAKKRERETEENKKAVSKSHRDRIEEFNDKLGSLTELNDIPRVRIAELLSSLFFIIYCIFLLVCVSPRLFCNHYR